MTATIANRSAQNRRDESRPKSVPQCTHGTTRPKSSFLENEGSPTQQLIIYLPIAITHDATLSLAGVDRVPTISALQKFLSARYLVPSTYRRNRTTVLCDCHTQLSTVDMLRGHCTSANSTITYSQCMGTLSQPVSMSLPTLNKIRRVVSQGRLLQSGRI